MKKRGNIILFFVAIITLYLVACNVFDDDYVWDDWAIALFKK